MQTRVKVVAIQGVGPKVTPGQNGAPPTTTYTAFVVSFVPVDPSADGTPTGDMHLGGATPIVSFLVDGENAKSLAINKEFLLTLQPA